MSEAKEELSKAKLKLKELEVERDRLEDEIDGLMEKLQKGKGLTGGLVDNEGFPVGDYGEIVEVRASRNKLSMLQTDHKDVMKQIEQMLVSYHSLLAQVKADSNTTTSTTPSSSIASVAPSTAASSSSPSSEQCAPLCSIGAVSESSPSESAGLKVGDLILKFGSVTQKSETVLQDISRVVRESENQVVDVEVLRGDGVKVSLKLTPAKWSGVGLLGCFIQPIK